MPSPFPGMDPYLEHPSLWPDVHHEFISQIRAALNPRLRPNYIARVETRMYVSDVDDPGRQVMIPDLRVDTRPKGKAKAQKPGRAGSAVEIAEPIIFSCLLDETIEEAFLSIRRRASGSLVTVVEVLSPTNKVPGSSGRKSFLDKKRETLAGAAHWVEIDLLRAGDRSPSSPPLVESDYRVMVTRRDDRKEARYWPIQLRQALPVVGIPLLGNDPDAPLDLRTVLSAAYDTAEYDAIIDYTRPPVPPLSPSDARWANQLLRQKGLR